MYYRNIYNRCLHLVKSSKRKQTLNSDVKSKGKRKRAGQVACVCEMFLVKEIASLKTYKQENQ